MPKRVFSIEFKKESACLVVDKNYAITEACEAVDVSSNAIRKWVGRVRWLDTYR